MDPADAAPPATPVEPVAGDPPSIGVPSIPAQGDQAPVPAPVPSLSGPPPPLRSTPLRLAQTPPTPPNRGGPPGEGTDSARPAADTAPEQDTDPGFAPGVADRLRSYVYLLVDPRTGRAFFVGRGRGDRCFRHLAAARGDCAGPGEGKFPMLERIREIERQGCSVRVDLLRYGMGPDEASVVEAAVHDALGLPAEPRLGSQRRPAAELNELLAKPAKFKRVHQVVLLRIGGTGGGPPGGLDGQRWPIDPRWTDLDSRRSPQWAVTVVGDLVAAVYRIERWERDPPAVDGRGTDSTDAGSQGPADRYALVGRRDPELEERYVGRNVSHYVDGTSSNPVTYVGCGPHWVDSLR